MIDISDSWSIDPHVVKVRKDCLSIIDYMMNERGSLRQAEENLCIPRSTIHNYIHSYIKSQWCEEYRVIVKILEYNKRYRCKPRRCWRGHYGIQEVL